MSPFCCIFVTTFELMTWADMRLITSLLMFVMGVLVYAQQLNDDTYVFTEASDLTLIGKIHDGTPNPYHRVDTVKYKGFTASENSQVRMPAGIAVVFRTDSPEITVKTVYKTPRVPLENNAFSARGYDMYIRHDGRWIYAASGVSPDRNMEANRRLAYGLGNDMKECLLYLPLYSELASVKIGVCKGSSIEAMENPFSYRIAVFGSSYTHGSSTSRSGMTWPALLSRETGLHLLALGCAGNSRLQPYFAAVLRDADADAFLFDAFSNPSSEEMKERLFPFIETIQQAHPGKPLIFQKTIRREYRNFNADRELSEQERMDTADSLMAIAVKRYENVWYIVPDATADDNNASVDGIHPDNYGYSLWARSIEKPLKRILKKYGIEFTNKMKRTQYLR